MEHEQSCRVLQTVTGEGRVGAGVGCIGERSTAQYGLTVLDMQCSAGQYTLQYTIHNDTIHNKVHSEVEHSNVM